MYIAIFNNIKHTPYGPLSKWATGMADYHVGFTDLTDYWDQDLLFRKRKWNPRDEQEVTLIKLPLNITPKDLDEVLFKDVDSFCIEKSFKRLYGYRDYIGFALRKLGLKFNYNFEGVVCSGRVRDILYSFGWTHLGTPKDLEPSPTDIRKKLMELNYPIIRLGNLH